MKKLLIDSDELGLCVVSNDQGATYTLVFDHNGGVSIEITRAQAFTVAKALADDLIKGIPVLAAPGPRIPVITPELAEAHAILDEDEDLPHTV